MFRLCLSVLCAIICAGCGSPHASDLRIDSALHAQFEVEGSLQTVANNIAKKNDECRVFGAGYVSIFEELGEARIEYKPTDRVLMALIDLKKHGGKIHVSIYAESFAKKRSVQTLEYGAKGLPGCP